MKFIKLFSILFYLLCITRCNELFPDDKLSIKPISYEGNELKINGYYYQHHYLGKPEEDLSAHVLFRNGIVRYVGGGYKNFDEIEAKISDPNLYDGKTAWGIFVINRDVITFEQWHSGMGGGLPVFFREGKILPFILLLHTGWMELTVMKLKNCTISDNFQLDLIVRVGLYRNCTVKPYLHTFVK